MKAMDMAEAISNRSVTVGTSVVQVSPDLQHGQVIARIYVNTSTSGQVITLAWGVDAIAGQGIVLYPAGTHAEALDSAFIPSNLKVSAVASASGGTLAIQERVRI